MNILLVAGARPNFMKIAPLVHELSAKKKGTLLSKVLRTKHKELSWKIVHTGQHYDYEMSKVFFEELDIPEPDYFLDAGSGSHAEQTSKIMLIFERVCLQEKPDVVVVVGDVNSTLACSVTAKKLNIRVGHVEAGLRSFDMTMPEEINRIVTEKNINVFNLEYILQDSDVRIVPPMSYLKFLDLWKDASLVLTDSGGIQEETTVLGIPCFTIRENTERPITIKQGTNMLVGTTGKGILKAYKKFKKGRKKKGKVPKFWDGKTAGRIVKILLK